VRRLFDSLFHIAVAVWVGGLLAIGYIAAPVLFRHQPDRVLAGELAGAMFAIMAWLGIALAIYLLGYLLLRHGRAACGQWPFRLVLLMLVLTLGGYFGVQPQIVAIKQDVARAAGQADVLAGLQARFAAWHGLASTLYLVQTLCGLALAALAPRTTRGG